MSRKVMRGAQPVRYAIAEYLAQAYPVARRKLLRTWPDMKASDLPSIVSFSAYEVLNTASNMRPVAGLEITRSSNFVRTDISDLAETEHRPRYSVRLTFWMYSQSDAGGESVPDPRPNVTRQRDDNMAILRACLLDKPTVGTGDFLYVEETSVNEDYLSPVPVANNSQRWIVGGQISFDVLADEAMSNVPINDPTKENVFIFQTVILDPIVDDENSHMGRIP